MSQTYKKRRVIVVAPDDADVDGVCADFDVDVARLEASGMANAINFGWSLDSESEYITWIGDDDLLAPGSLERTTALLSKRLDCGMVYGRVRYIDANGTSLWMSRPTRFAAPYLRLGKNFLSQQGSLLRRSAVARVGYLDGGLMNAMDQDLFTRLGRVGLRAYLPYELGAFRWHTTSITSTKGSRDESDLVRRRYIEEWQIPLYDAWRRIGRRLDWVVDATVRRMPAPPPPTFGGMPYISPRAHLKVAS